MKLRATIARDLGRVTTWGLVHIFRRNATQLPGRVALAADPQVLKVLSQKLSEGSIVTCGTNGKTTTNNVIARALEMSGKDILSNRVGANMLPGIVGALLPQKSAQWAVLEVDELSTITILPDLQPSYFVLLNLFRDQLDRAGEIDRIQDVLTAALTSSPSTTLIACGDDPMSFEVARRAQEQGLSCEFFGIAEDLHTTPDRVAEARFCQVCGAELDYQYRHYAQLGAFSCPECDFKRPELTYQAKNCQVTQNGVSFEIHSSHFDYPVKLEAHFGGSYMIYNLMAAFVAAHHAGVSAETFQKALDTYHPKNGRLQHFLVDRREVVLNLAKNPTGYNQNITLMLNDKRPIDVYFSINDNDNDGCDISWIWDIDFERLQQSSIEHVYVSGLRAHDVQVRLKYAGIASTLVSTVQEALDDSQKTANPLYALTNYSALWPAKAELERIGESND